MNNSEIFQIVFEKLPAESKFKVNNFLHLLLELSPERSPSYNTFHSFCQIFCK